MLNFRRAPLTPQRIVSGLRSRWRSWSERRHPARPIRSVYGPLLTPNHTDRTFRLAVTGYGPFIPQVLSSIARPFVFLDVGANQGIFSLVAATLPLCSSVVAVEAISWTFSYLVQNILANDSGTRISAICGAVADTPEAIALLSYDPAHSGISQVGAGTVASPVIGPAALDSLLRGDLPIAVKIDVEGAELSVLAALRRATVYARVTDIIVEVSRGTDNDRPEIVLALLAGDGFRQIASSPSWEHDTHDAHYRRHPVG